MATISESNFICVIARCAFRVLSMQIRKKNNAQLRQLSEIYNNIQFANAIFPIFFFPQNLFHMRECDACDVMRVCVVFIKFTLKRHAAAAAAAAAAAQAKYKN